MNRSSDWTAGNCLVVRCPNPRSQDAPLCDQHLIEAWRWVEAHPEMKPERHGLLIGRKPTQRRVERPVVYYAQLPGGDIKIGTTVGLKSRISALRLNWPGAVLAVEFGSYDTERARHHQFADERRGNVRLDKHQREDFAPSERLLIHIAAVREANGDPIGYARVYETT